MPVLRLDRFGGSRCSESSIGRGRGPGGVEIFVSVRGELVDACVDSCFVSGTDVGWCARL